MHRGSRGHVTEPLTALLGRDALLGRVEQALRSGRRLLTLLGAPGIGKTRLASALSARAGGAFAAGVLRCDLSEARSAADVRASVWAALGVQALGAEGDRALVERLGQSGALLLVLDGAEAAADAVAALVPGWLAAVGALACVVTSRERLRLAGELAFELAPLDEAAACELFAQRAQEVRADFALGDEERAVVAQIAARLDGIPLAIELAAAQMVVQSPSGLLAELQRGTAVLDAGFRGAPARHATLRAAVESSLERLDPRERAVLRQCAVFEAPFSQQAALAVVELASPGPPLPNVLRRLCDGSLVRREPGEDAVGDGRFRLLSIVREHVGAELAERGELEAALERHARLLLAAERPARPELRAIAERGLRAVAGSGVSRGDALRALCKLAEDGPDAELLAQLDRALEPGGDASAEAVAAARLARGRLRLHAGQGSGAREDFEAVLRAGSDPRMRAAAFTGLGNLARQQGQRAEAQGALEAALACYAQAEDRIGQARVLASLGGLMHERGEISPARELHERALALYRELGDERGAAVVLQNAGLIVQEQGRLEEAEAIFRQALERHLELGNRRFEGIALFDLAALCMERGLWSRARALAERALAVLRESGDRRQAALALALEGACSAALGQLGQARRALDQAEAQLAAIEDRAFSQVVEVHRGHLDLALALRAYATGADDASGAHLEHAARRPARATRAARRAAAAPEHDSDELRLAARILRGALAQHRKLDQSLFVAGDQSWLRGPRAERADVSSRRVLRRLLAALVDRRLTAPESPLSRAELLRSGWPDERVASAPALNRLHVAITQLRKLGLEHALLRRDEGYLIDPSVNVVVIDTAA